MKVRRLCGVGALALAFTLGLATSAYTQEHHPEIRAAQRLLEQAMDHLQHADRDFGGHRVKAMDHIRAAQHELHEALEYDRR